MVDYSGSTALITGASSGIGESLARLLAERGIGGLILVARSADRLEALAAELRGRHQAQVTVIPADLSDPATPARIRAETERLGRTVDILVNNAGFGSYGSFEGLEPERETAMVAVNVAAVVALTRAYLPEMAAHGCGGVINIASTAAFQPVPYMATYGATKAFVLSFSEALWAENRDRGVRVVCVCPGATATQFGAAVGKPRGNFEKVPESSPEEVAEAALKAWEANASYAVVGRANYLGALATRLAPRAAVARLSASFFRPMKAPTQASQKTTLSGLAIGLAAGCIALVIAMRRNP